MYRLSGSPHPADPMNKQAVAISSQMAKATASVNNSCERENRFIAGAAIGADRPQVATPLTLTTVTTLIVWETKRQKTKDKGRQECLPHRFSLVEHYFPRKPSKPIQPIRSRQPPALSVHSAARHPVAPSCRARSGHPPLARPPPGSLP